MYILLGLGSYELSEEHVEDTARVLTEINPAIFRFRTLNILPNTPLWKEWKSGKFELLKPVDCIKEDRDIIAYLNLYGSTQITVSTDGDDKGVVDDICFAP